MSQVVVPAITRIFITVQCKRFVLANENDRKELPVLNLIRMQACSIESRRRTMMQGMPACSIGGFFPEPIRAVPASRLAAIASLEQKLCGEDVVVVFQVVVFAFDEFRCIVHDLFSIKIYHGTTEIRRRREVGNWVIW